MRWTLLRNCLFTTSVLTLSGCLVINAALSTLGLLGSGGLEYASTVYSVAEYTYEYAANDKTPDEVIEDKLAWLILPDEEATMVAKTRHPSHPSMTSDRPDLHLLAQQRAPVRTVRRKAAHSMNTPVMTASLSHKPKKAAAAKPKQARQQQVDQEQKIPAIATALHTDKISPPHQYIERDANPLQTRLDKLELAFAQAERMAAHSTTSGMKLSVQPDGRAPENQGINGSWSIRHTLMQAGPMAAADSTPNTKTDAAILAAS